MRADAGQATALLRGAVDIHVHTAPDVYPRNVGALEAAVEAKRAGMRALVLKSHSTDTADRAELASQYAQLPVFGGVVLNLPVGGLNPYAVRESVRQGGRVVWMPTVAAEHFIRHADAVPMLNAGMPRLTEGLTVLDGENLSSEAHRIVELVAEHDLLLCSGHLSPVETLAVFRAARASGCRRLAVTHPNLAFTSPAREQVLELISLGAFLEVTAFGDQREAAQLIRTAGVENCLLSSDAGAAGGPGPVDGFGSYLSYLTESGFTPDELRYMADEVPSFLLRLKGGDARPVVERGGRGGARQAE